MKLIYRFLFFIAFLISYQGMAQSGLKLGTAPGTLTANAILDLSGTSTRGLLLPSVTLAATNSISPLSATVASGMFVYNTATAGTFPNNVTPGIYYYDGSVWVRAQDNLGNHTATQDINMGRFGLSGFADANPTTGNNDDWKIFGSGNAENGSLVIQTGDNGNEPIVFQQRESGTVSERMRINNTGALQVSGLSGTGIRLVTASSAGVLSTQTMLDLSNIGGTLPLAKLTAGTSGQILQMSAGTTTTPTWVTPTTASSLNIYTADGTLTGARTVTQLGNNLTFSGVGSLSKRSNSTASAAVLTVGRTSTEAEFGVAGSASDGFTATSVGDVWLKSNINGGNLFLGTAGTGAELHLMTNNAERMVIAPGGNVGIGTSNPAFKLDVAGTVRSSFTPASTNVGGVVELSTPGGDPGIIIRSTGSTASTATTLSFRSNMRRLSTGLLINNSTTGGLDSTFFIQNNGNVGIGRIKPARVLHTFGDAVRFDRDGGSNGENPMPQALFVNTNGSEIYKTWVSGMANSTMDYVINDFGTAVGAVDGTQRFVIKGTNGNVGIGTSNPTMAFHLEQTGFPEQMLISNSGTSNEAKDNAGLRIQSTNRNVDLNLVSNVGNESRITFARTNPQTVSAMLRGSTDGFDIRTNDNGNGSVALSVDKSQNVGIGTGVMSGTTSGLILAKLHVTGGNVLFDVNENTTASSRHVLVRGNATPTDYATPGTAALDVSSKSRGFLPPRMTAKQIQDIPFGPTTADSLKSEGLVVYCTDCVPKTIMMFDGSEWLSPTGETFPKNIEAPVVSSPSISLDSNNQIKIETTDGNWDPETGLKFTYKWFKNGTLITGQTGSSINITPVANHTYKSEVSVWGSISVSSNIYTVPFSAVSISTNPPIAIVAYGNFYEVSTAGQATNASSTSYSWEYQTTTNIWTNIVNASNLTYNASDSYYGRPIRVKFKATNLFSKDSTYSNVITYAPLFEQTAISNTVRALYSVRKLRAAHPSTNAMIVRNLRTDVQTTIGFDTKGNLNTSQLTNALSASNDTLVVMRWYDQSGNGRDAIAPSEDEAPTIVLGGKIQYLTGNRPTLVFDGDNDFLKVSTGLPMAVSSGIEMFFALRQNQPFINSPNSYRNGGVLLFSNIDPSSANEMQHFGAGPYRSSWVDTFASTGKRNELENINSTLEDNVDRGRNYVGSIRHNGTNAKIRATLNSDQGNRQFKNKYHHYVGKENSTIDTSIEKLWIGTIAKGSSGQIALASQNNYSEIFIVQSLPNISSRRRIFSSLGDYYGIGIGSNGSN